jgi:ATP-dependent RNA helicase RhlE
MTPEIEFASLGLAEPLLRAVEETGYTIPTPIQVKAIPLVLAGGDLLAAAQTGTGKTAGFVLPILHRLLENPPAGTVRPGRPRCLILTPTRELAAQVEESVRTYGKNVPITSMVIFGGVGIQPQMAQLRKRMDIVVATPGRLLDHVGQKTIDLSGVEILVLDEGDRMLDMGFIHDIKRILALLPKVRQSMLFSATFSEEVRALANQLLNKPGCIDVAPRNTESALVQQTVHLVAKDQKRDLLSHLIRENKWEQVLVFTRTKHGANRLAEKLERDGIPAAAIHGNKSQGARTRALAQFKAGEVPVLVATDIAARGLDIVELPHVVNFELPNVAEDYVHRIGRTGRAGSMGSAISLVDSEEIQYLRAIEKLIRHPIERATVEGFVPGTSQDSDRDDERPRGRTQRGERGRQPQRARQPQREASRQPAAPRQRAPGARPQGAAPNRPHQPRRAEAEGNRPHQPRRIEAEGNRPRRAPRGAMEGPRVPLEARDDNFGNRARPDDTARNRPVDDDSFGNRIRNTDRDAVERNRHRAAREGNVIHGLPNIEADGNRAHETVEVDGNTRSEAARHQAQPQPALFSPRPQARRR